MKLGLLFTPALILHFALSGLSAQTFSTFDEVDYVTVQDFSVFQEIWGKAETENVRIALFGDSQETSPGGFGRVYIPALNYEFYQHFGKVGESFVAPGTGSYGGGSPAAEWLLQGSFGSGNGNSSVPADSKFLPGTGSRLYTSSALGMLTMLNTENTNLGDNSFLESPEPLWNSDAVVTATLFGVSRTGSDELSWRTKPTNGIPNFFLPDVQTGTTSMGLDSDAGILSEDVGPLSFDGMNRQQLLVRGSGSNGAEFLGVRFKNLSTPGGVSIQDFAAGGYTTSSFLNNHADAGPMLQAFGPWDAIVIHTGANDAYSGGGASAIEFQTRLATLIASIRGPDWLGNPNQKFILVTDPYIDRFEQPQTDQFAQYAGAMAELALNDPNIMAINSRRLTQEAGWNESNPSEYLSDFVHYNSRGASVMAEADFVLMRGGGLLGDLDFDGDVDVLGDAFALISNLGRTDADYSDGDINLDDTVSVLEDAFPLISNLGQTN